MAYDCHSIQHALGQSWHEAVYDRAGRLVTICKNGRCLEKLQANPLQINGRVRKTTLNNILKKEETVVQRLSAEVAGKAQKYSRIGPREFVPYTSTMR